jgi:squalene synthase HpnC
MRTSYDPLAPPEPPTLGQAYSMCARLARRHYENFPVASRLLPRSMRRHLQALYAYARGVDDLGDEAAGDRLVLLDRWEAELLFLYGLGPEPPGKRPAAFVALGATVEACEIPMEPLQRLIEANRRDQHKSRYASWEELRDYCAHSADPVGRCVLAVFGYPDPRLHPLSDAVCTGLQLVNFCQDIARDLARGRLYLPARDLERFGVTEQDLRAPSASGPLRDLVRFECERARALLNQGRALPPQTRGRLRLALALFIEGGQAVLDRIEADGYDPLVCRPVLDRRDRRRLLWRALRFRPVPGAA